jgi:hypothetical protein
MQASHGGDCAGPPATHPVDAYDESVFQCRDHVMTAINGEAYGLIYLTPDHMVDFANGEAVVKFDVSTLRSSMRDWWDVWITPYEDNLQLAGEDWYPDLQGPPRRAIHVKMQDYNNGQTGFTIEVFRDFRSVSVPGDSWLSYEQFLTPDAARRDTFELRISRTHLRFGMPTYNRWWVDTNIGALEWTRGVVQIGHHSYNPSKDPKVPGAHAGTWHWDNVSISPAVPFRVVNAEPRVANPSVTLASPAPANAQLRFAGIGSSLQASFDNGATWVNATRQQQAMNTGDHFASYWMPIPAGTRNVQFRGQSFCCGPWQVRDVSVWSSSANGPGAIQGFVGTASAPATLSRPVAGANQELSCALPATT